MELEQPRRKWIPVAAWSLAVIVAAGAGWWAATVATRPPAVTTPETTTTTVEVVSGTVEVVQEYGIDVSWPAAPLGVNGYSGTLTELGVDAGGSTLAAGDVAYSVDLHPAVVAVGSTPAFRSMSTGDKGADVKQLQQFLKDEGFDPGSVNSSFGKATADAVNRWSATLGEPKNGTVPLGRLVFVPSLPSQLAPATDVRVGLRVEPGAELLVGPSGEPQFSFRVLPEDVARTTEGMRVTVTAGSSTWEAEVSSLAADPDTGTTIALLRPANGAESICGDDCATAVAVGGKTVLPGTLIITPETSGSQVPTTAIGADSAGATFVILESGMRQPVAIEASSDGASIVTGVEVGDRVLVTVAASGN
ncbi:peptidoglycan-binding protein [Demequina sp.]|uniref:peptidoglycan-binding protein n=1 Tax=Demequina sp. TaxID=2050685 RepID=UPI003D11ADF5